eukprot:UN05599
MTGLWKDPDNIFATNSIQKKLQKTWKEDFKAHKKKVSKTEMNPSKIFKQLCKSLKFKSVADELSRSSGFPSSNSARTTHVEVDFSIIMQTHYNKLYLKLKVSKYYDGQELITKQDDQRFEHSIYLLNSGRALLFGTVLTNLNVVLPYNVIDVVALYLNPPKHYMEEIDQDEESGHSLLLYTDNQKLQKEHKMQTEWNGFFLNIITKWLSLGDNNEFDVHRFLQYLLSWFLTEKTQKCISAI